MADYLYCDLETRSPVPIKHGTHAYAEQAEVMLWAYARNDGEVKLWDRAKGETMPGELYAALMDEGVTIVGHNWLMFDNTVLRYAHPKLHLPAERIHDTMTQALAHGLPGSLDKLSEVFGLSEEEAKIKDGKRLIRLFCIPNKDGSWNTYETHPNEWRDFRAYAARDISSMRSLHRKMPQWNYSQNRTERAIVALDQRINNRGFAIDRDLALGALRAISVTSRKLAARTTKLTDGAVLAATQRDKLLKHLLAAHGVELPDLTAATLERRVNDPELPEVVRELIRVRMMSSTSSTTKYRALLDMLSSDSRLRGTIQIYGASRTGRWAGRGFQVQNLPSKNILPPDEIAVAVEAFKVDAADLIFDDVMRAASSCIRGVIVPSPGKKLYVSDLSNIEGRDAAWLAGEQWKLDAFRAFDAGDGHDLYALAYAKAFGVTPEAVMKNKKQGGNWRQIGKVMELALGYQGGVGAFITFADIYGIDLEAMAAEARSNISPAIWGNTAWSWKRAQDKNQTFGLSEQAYRVCEAFKQLWRSAHPEISSYWDELELAFIAAVQNPGRDIRARKVTFKVHKGWLKVRLPSGRFMCYCSPKVENADLSYLGVNSYTRKWQRIKTYGGKMFENICQAVARDIMAENMLDIEKAGFEILMTVHDEVVTEAEPHYSADDLSALLATPPEWAPDIPLAAGGHSSERYSKE